MATGACEFCPYEYIGSKAMVLLAIHDHERDEHGVGRVDNPAPSMVDCQQPKSDTTEEHMSKETDQVVDTNLYGAFAIGKETPNYRRLEAKSMDNGDMFGSLYILPESLPEGATKVFVTVSFE